MIEYRFAILIFYFSFSIFSFNIICDDAPVVETQQGPIKGFSELGIYVYLGIPYATPPVGKLRWTEPVEHSAWSPNVLDATTYKPACPQHKGPNCNVLDSCPVSFDEDCLYLNVFVPETIKTGDKKAVLLFIHGGSFVIGGNSAQLYNSTFLSSVGDVIVVTINYRLGALGFLATGLEDDQLHGNYGILDQKLAIRWVHDNIGSFGGDSNRITIFGQSAGAESVSIHLVSADIQPYFTSGIVQSSPISLPFRTLEEMLALYEYFADYLNCAARDIECLKNKTADEIIAAQSFAASKITSFKFLESTVEWLPYIDGKVIKGQLLEIDKWLEDEKFELKPFMIGTLTEEAVFFIFLEFLNPLSLVEYIELGVAAFKQHVIKVLEYYPPDFTTNDQRNRMSTIATRWIFSCSSRRFLELYMSQAPQNPYYMYVFDFAIDYDGWGNYTFCVNRTCHSADLPYTFDQPDENFTLNGHLLAMQHINYWSNFAKYKSPNGNETEPYQINDFLYWPKYDTTNRHNIRFKEQPLIIESNYIKDDCDFFDSIGYYYKNLD